MAFALLFSVCRRLCFVWSSSRPTWIVALPHIHPTVYRLELQSRYCHCSHTTLTLTTPTSLLVTTPATPTNPTALTTLTTTGCMLTRCLSATRNLYQHNAGGSVGHCPSATREHRPWRQWILQHRPQSCAWHWVDTPLKEVRIALALD